MIKFLNTDDKKQKIKETVELLKKHNKSNTVNNIYNTNSSGVLGLNNNGQQIILNNNNINGISGTSTTNTTPFAATGTSNITITGTSNITGISGNSGISTGISINTTSNTFVGYSHVIHSHKIFDVEVDLWFLPNAEMVVSLIHILGIEFWDEYKTQCDLTTNYPDVCITIESVLKPKRRDQKIDDIINDENK